MSAYSAAVLADSPILYARLGETAGSYGDSSTNANAGALTGVASTRGAASLIPGDPADLAITFSGAGSNYVLFPDHAAYRAVSDVVTLEGWISTSAAVNGSIVSFGDNGAYIRISAAGALQFLKSQVAVIGTTTQTYADGHGHHMVVTKNGATVKFYVDGADVTPAITNATFLSRTSGIIVGGDMSGGTPVLPWCTGTVDEVAVYDYALTQAQAQAHYNASFTSSLDLLLPMMHLGMGR